MTDAPHDHDDGGSPERPGVIARAGRSVAAATATAGRAGGRAAKGFWDGFRYPGRGARFVYLENPSLVRIWIWPFLITLGLFAGLAVGIWAVHDDLLSLLWAPPTGTGTWARVQAVLRPVAQAVLFLLLVVGALVLLARLSALLAGPFNGRLSEEVERIQKGLPEQPFSFEALLRDLWLTIRLEAAKLVVFVPVMAGAFLLSLLLPVVGQAVYALFGALFTITYNAVDYTDWPLARRGFGPTARALVLKRRFLRLLGLGTTVWLLLLVPILGLLAMPAGVAGGTLLVLDMEDEGLLEPPGGATEVRP